MYPILDSNTLFSVIVDSHPPPLAKNGNIRVQASDNVLVIKVSITILDHEGKVLELGEAIEAEELWWEYVSAVAGKTIVAEARDLAGNVTRAEAEQFQ